MEEKFHKLRETLRKEFGPIGPIYCSFCGKNQHEVKKIIAGPSAYICDECVLIGVEVMWGDEAKAYLEQRPPLPPPPGLDAS